MVDKDGKLYFIDFGLSDIEGGDKSTMGSFYYNSTEKSMIHGVYLL